MRSPLDTQFPQINQTPPPPPRNPSSQPPPRPPTLTPSDPNSKPDSEHQKLAKAKILTRTSLNLTSKCRVVSDLDSFSVFFIDRVVLNITHSILGGCRFSFDVPLRSASNQTYVPELDRIVLKDKSIGKHFCLAPC